MLSGETPPPPPVRTPDSGEASADGGDAAGAAPSEPIAIPDLPPEVDHEFLTLEIAVQAIRERDEALFQMRELLLTRQAAGEFAHVTSLHDLPDFLRERLQKLEADWQAKFRHGELELSRERARLSRMEVTHRHQQEQIQKELKRLGLVNDDEQAARESGESEPRRRWFRFLGRKDQQ